MVRIRGVKCALSTDGHLLKDDGVLITNPKYVEFARKRRKDFRPENRVCAECAKVFIHLYNMKIKSAKEKKQRHSLTVSSSSSLDDFDRIVYKTPRTKHLRDFVKQNAPFDLGGQSQELNESVEKENLADNGNAGNISCESNTHSLMVSDDSSVGSLANVGSEEAAKSADKENISDINGNSQNLSTDARPRSNASTTTTNEVRIEENNWEPNVEAVLEVVSNISDKSQNSSQEVRLTTNASMTATNDVRSRSKHTEQAEIITGDSTVWRKPTQPAKRKRVHIAPQPTKKYFSSNLGAPTAANKQISTVSANSSTTSDDDFDDYQPSLNALNGTRLPNIQPIPKRRQFQHAIPTVQDIYMQGITGG